MPFGNRYRYSVQLINFDISKIRGRAKKVSGNSIKVRDLLFTIVLGVRNAFDGLPWWTVPTRLNKEMVPYYLVYINSDYL